MLGSKGRTVLFAVLGGVILLASCSRGSKHESVLTQASAVTVGILHDVSVIPPRAQEAMSLDPLGVFTGVAADQRMNVGVRVDLSLDTAGATSVTDVQWNVSGAVIAGYSLDAAVDLGEGYLDACETIELTAQDLQQPTLSFYYTDIGVSTVTVDAVVDGVAMIGSRTFDVRRHPKAEIFLVTGPGSGTTLTDLNGDATLDQADFLLYQETFGHEVDPAGTMGFGLIGEHNAWHELNPTQTNGDEFLRFHRAYLEKADCWRGIFGYPCIQAYATAPNVVPSGPDIDHFGVGAGATCDLGMGMGDGNGIIAQPRDPMSYGMIEELPLPLTLAGDGSVALGDHASASDLVLAMIGYHDRIHANVTGDFQNDCTSPADPLFWRFHRTLGKVHELWQFLKLADGSVTIPPIECTGPNGTPVFLPDPAVRVDPGCSMPVAFNLSMPSGSAFPLGTTTVTGTVSDVMMLDPGFGGTNPGTTQTISFEVTIVDTTAPELTCPEDFVAECEGPEGTPVTFETTATDLCDTAPFVTSEPASGSLFPHGVTTVTTTATDSSGNVATCSFTVTVADTTAPAIDCPSNVTAECEGPEGTVVEFTVSATDACDPDPVVVSTPPSGTAFPEGVTVVEIVATDASGNTSTCTFEVNVVDTTPPEITCPEDVLAECTGPAGAVVEFEVSAEDACDPDPVVTTTPASGSTFPLGTTVVEVEATDAAGNSSTCSFAVTVADTTPPDLVIDPDPAMLWPPNHKYVTFGTSDFVQSVSDLCDETVDVSSVRIMEVTSDEPENMGAEGSGNTRSDIVLAADCRSVDLRAERTGGGNGRVYTIMVGVADSSGNTATGVYRVMIPHDQGMGRDAVDDGPAYSVTCGSDLRRPGR